MKTEIRRRALELGFDDCRFTTADPPPGAPRFERWLAAGRHGEMAYLQRNAFKRVAPEQVLPGARSVVCLAASYAIEGQGRGAGLPPDGDPGNLPGESGPGGRLPPRPAGGKPALQEPGPPPPVAPDAPAGNPPPTGVVARYARYADYHHVLGERLRRLAEWMDGLGDGGARSLGYVDTGPMLERDLAQRAGVGFVGKHTNLIHREFGNWVFLAEIITTLELEPDTPGKNHCGTCTRCLAACPTGAITGPFELDSRLCISYLTIELKGPIPLPLRPAIGNRIFGCDDCLAACPWNRFAREGRLLRDHARTDLEGPGLIELLALDEDGFRRRFSGTPILRTKRRGLLRNVCVALGNVGRDSALLALERAASDPEPLVAEHARWAIEQIGKRTEVK